MPSLYYLAPVGFNTWLSHVSIAMSTALRNSLCFPHPSAFPVTDCVTDTLAPSFWKCHTVGVLYSMEHYIRNKLFCLFLPLSSEHPRVSRLSPHNLVAHIDYLSIMFTFEYNHNFFSPISYYSIFWIPSSFEQLGIRCKPRKSSCRYKFSTHLDKYLWLWWLDYMYNRDKFPTCLPPWLYNVAFPQAVMGVLIALQPCQCLLLSGLRILDIVNAVRL